MRITTILPVSRVSYLDRILESLKRQTYKIEHLIVIFDGSEKDYELVRSRVIEQPYPAICVKSNNIGPAFTIMDRRKNISSIHNQFKELVGDCDWVFSVEDDSIVPDDALQRLVSSITQNTGMITGVELGRWGVQYVGAWRADSVHFPRLIKSVPQSSGVEEIDASGLYCALIRSDLYKAHEFYSSNGLGPDINLGLYIKRQGFNNYINWDVPVTHLTNWHGLEVEIPATDKSQVVKLTNLGNNEWANEKSS